MNRFDAVIADPPYGFRAAARKAVKSTSKQYYIYFSENPLHGSEITSVELLVNRLFEYS